MAAPEPQQFGEFAILGKLGQGAMGAVYKARQTSLNRIVALKLLPAHYAGDPDFLARFKNEAMAAASLNHSNIVQVYAAGEDSGTHFFAMEYVEGESLGARLERKGRIDAQEAIAIACHLAQALDYAWKKARVIHRDIKPDNIFLSREGTVKLGDLGLAKVLGNQGGGLTQTGAAMGTPYYVSPEQAMGNKEIDFRADIYSLGCTIYHAMTGLPPYQGESAMAVMLQHISQPPPKIQAVWPACPPPLIGLLDRMLRKRPEERHESYEALLQQLYWVAERLDQPSFSAAAAASLIVPMPLPRSESTPDAARRSAPVVNRPIIHAPPPPRGSGKMLAIISAIAAVAVALFVWQPWKVPMQAPNTTSALTPIPPRTDAGPSPHPQEKVDEQVVFHGKEKDNGLRDQAVDLLSQVDPARDTLKGRWERSGKGLELFGEGKVAVLEIAYEPPDEYDFTIEFSVKDGKFREMGQIFPCNGLSTAWKMGSGFDSPTVFGIHVIDGIGAADPKRTEAIVSRPRLSPGVRHSSTVQVRTGKISAVLDGEEILNWTGDFRRLGLDGQCRLRNPLRLGLTSFGTSATLYRIEITPFGSASARAPGAASKEAPFENSLGMKFVPVTGTQALFSIWETRVQDYAAYARVKQVDDTWKKGARGAYPISREPEYPVCSVGWDDSAAFCQWLTEKETAEGKLPNGAKYRLPSDEEWSRAVGLDSEQGATPAEKHLSNRVDFPWGIEYPPKRTVGNYPDTACRAAFPQDKGDAFIEGYTDGYAVTSPVGSFEANKFGIYDLGGNVWEWCDGWFDTTNRERFFRGGSWWPDNREMLLSSYRFRRPSSYRGGNNGFRCVLDLGGSAKAAATASLPTPTPVPPPIAMSSDAEGFTPLFNGRDLTGWHIRNPAGRNAWKAENGVLRNDVTGNEQGAQRGEDLVSDEKFWNFTVQYEYQVPENANSGVYFRGRHELQILGDFKKAAAVMNADGSLYDQKPPDVYASDRSGGWNRIEATMIGAKLTVLLNGKQIHNAVDCSVLPKFAQPLDADVTQPGPFLLQGTKSPVSFRNIRIKRLPDAPSGTTMLTPAPTPAPATKPVDTPDSIAQKLVDIEGSIGGIGAVLGDENGALHITNITPGGPAERAGLQAGWKIAEINSIPASRMAAQDAVKLIRGPVGTDLKLEVVKTDGTRQELTLARAKILLSPVEGRLLADGSLLIKLTGYDKETVAAVSGHMKQHRNARGIVLDLRGSGYGLTSVVTEVAGLFLPKGSTLWFDRWPNGGITDNKTTTDPITKLPLTVLTDAKTIKGGELLASGLQRNQRARVVGQPTAGDRTPRRQVAQQKDGALEMQVTSESLLSRDGKATNVVPDTILPATATDDDFLKAATR